MEKQPQLNRREMLLLGMGGGTALAMTDFVWNHDKPQKLTEQFYNQMEKGLELPRKSTRALLLTALGGGAAMGSASFLIDHRNKEASKPKKE